MASDAAKGVAGSGSASRGRRALWVQLAAFVVVTAAVFLIASMADGPVHARVLQHERTVAEWWSTDWHRMVRVVGYLPTWLLVALAIVLIDTGGGPKALWRGAAQRGLWILLATASASVGSELLKLVIRRQRPPLFQAWDGHYVWRAWSDGPLSSHNLALPSGHATVAFAGMFLLCRMYPRAAPVWLVLALGCAASRVIFHAHFVSDVSASAALAAATVWWVWALRRRWRRRDRLGP